jgi:phosphomannomutase
MTDIRLDFDPGAGHEDRIRLTDALAAAYRLDRWAANFSLMTAGFRDRLDPADLHNPAVVFNSLTVAILCEAKARVFRRGLAPDATPTVHLGGEVRPHTQAFIRIAARIYAAHGYTVHLRTPLDTTPIWYSSFGVAWGEYGSGDNFTASHSQFFKGGWKPLDGEGKQLVAEEEAIVAAVKEIVAGRQTITLAPWQPNARIVRDFDVDEAYAGYLRTILGERPLATLVEELAGDFRVQICTVGGSMRATSERIFARLGVGTGEGTAIRYLFGEEDPEYHRIGHVDGDIYGVDPGTARIYRRVGAQQALLSGAASFFLIWDPDGDRLKIAAPAPLAEAEEAERLGLEVDPERSGDRCVVYLTPNQLYLVLAASRLEAIEAAGALRDHDWFVGLSYPTTRSLAELAQAFRIPSVQVQVGFKHFGTLCETIERQLAAGRDPVTYATAAGETVALGRNPRALLMGEESGGANVGGADLLVSRTGARRMLALREKDGMQLGVLAMTLAAQLHREKKSFVRYYADLAERYGITHLHYGRTDVILYDESKMGAELMAEKERGAERRDRTMAYFKGLVRRLREGGSLDDVRAELNARRRPTDPPCPPLTAAYEAGSGELDGPILEVDGAWAMLRASGTDALLRYYVEARTPAEADALRDLLIHQRIG